MSKIEVNSQGHFVVIGELSFQTVPQINVRGKQLIAASPLPVFELQNITSSDNSSVALLTSWVRYAKNLHKRILFVDLPKQLLDIVEASGLEKLLPIKNN